MTIASVRMTKQEINAWSSFALKVEILRVQIPHKNFVTMQEELTDVMEDQGEHM